MPKASVKRLIECEKKQLIELVLDIEKYPEFVPFCLDSHVYEKNQERDLTLIIADLTIGKGPFKDTYKSDVRFSEKDSSINTDAIWERATRKIDSDYDASTMSIASSNPTNQFQAIAKLMIMGLADTYNKLSGPKKTKKDF